MAFMQNPNNEIANTFFDQELKVLLVNSNIAELGDAMETFKAASFPTGQLVKTNTCREALSKLKETLLTNGISPYRLIMVDLETLQ